MSKTPSETPRIPPLSLEAMDPVAAAALRKYERLVDAEGGPQPPRNVLSTVAQSPATLEAWMPFMDHARYRLLPLREREIVILRLSRDVGSDYGWGAHQAVSRRNKLFTDDDFASLLRDDAGPGFSARERALIAATDDLAASAEIGEAAWTGLRAAGLTDADAVDLVMLVGEYHLVAMVTRTFKTPLDEGLQPLPRREPTAP